MYIYCHLKYKTKINVPYMCTGKSFTKCVGLDIRKNRRTQYNPEIMPQLTTEFAGGAFRVPHNTLPSTYE